MRRASLVGAALGDRPRWGEKTQLDRRSLRLWLCSKSHNVASAAAAGVRWATEKMMQIICV